MISAKSTLLKPAVKWNNRWNNVKETCGRKKVKKKSWLSENNFVQHSVSHATRDIFSSKRSWPKLLKSGPKHIKTPLKTHIEALKIQKFSWGRAPQNPLTRGELILPLVLAPLSCLRHSMDSSAGPLFNARRQPCYILFSCGTIKSWLDFCDIDLIFTLRL